MTESAALRGRNVLFLLVHGFDSAHYTTLRHCLELQGAHIQLASVNHGDTLVSADHSVREESNVSFALAANTVYDAVVIADHVSAEALRDNPAVMRLIERARAHGGTAVVGVGEGVRLLLAAGVMQNVTVAAPAEMANAVADAGGRVSDSPIAVADNVFTAREQADMVTFCHAITHFLHGWQARAA